MHVCSGSRITCGVEFAAGDLHGYVLLLNRENTLLTMHAKFR